MTSLPWRSVGCVVASWLVHSSPDQELQVQTLLVDIALCSGAKQFTLAMPLLTLVYKLVPAVNLMLG